MDNSFGRGYSSPGTVMPEEEEPFTADSFILAYVSNIIDCILYVVPFLEFVQGRSFLSCKLPK